MRQRIIRFKTLCLLQYRNRPFVLMEFFQNGTEVVPRRHKTGLHINNLIEYGACIVVAARHHG